MTTALLGTVEWNTQTNTGSGNLNGVCADSTGTFGYGANSAGKLYQITLATGVLTGGSWPLVGFTTPNQVCISPDDGTLYVLQDNGNVYTVPVSAPAATLLGTFNQDSIASTWRLMVLEPGNPNRLLAGSTGGKKLYGMDAASGALSYYYQPSGSHFVQGFGVIPTDQDSILVTLGAVAAQNQAGGLLLRLKRKQQRAEVLLGNGSGTNSTGAGPAQGYATVNNNNNSACGDADGRIYLGRSAAAFTMIDTDGAVSDLNAALPQNITAGCVYCPAINRVLLGATGARIYVVK